MDNSVVVVVDGDDDCNLSILVNLGSLSVFFIDIVALSSSVDKRGGCSGKSGKLLMCKAGGSGVRFCANGTM